MYDEWIINGSTKTQWKKIWKYLAIKRPCSPFVSCSRNFPQMQRRLTYDFRIFFFLLLSHRTANNTQHSWRMQSFHACPSAKCFSDSLNSYSLKPFGVIFSHIHAHLKNYVAIEWIRSEAFYFIVFGWIMESGVFRQNFMQNNPCTKSDVQQSNDRILIPFQRTKIVEATAI